MPSYALRVHSCEEVVWSRRKAPNLYVVIYQDGRAIHRTNAVKRNRTPEWDAICNLSSDSTITLRLWHDCLLRCRDICLGAVDTEISALLDLASSDTEYIRLPLTSEDRGSGKHTGTVLVCLVHDGAAASMAIEQSKQSIGQLAHVSALMEAAGMVDSSQPAVKTFEAGLGIIITKLDMIIQIGNEVAKIHPYANMAWKVLTSVHQAVKAEQETQEKLKKLVDIKDTDALPQKIKSLENAVLAIVKQTVECAVFIREYSGHGFTARVMKNTWDNADKTIDDLSETLLKLKDSLEGSLTVHGLFLSAQVLQKVDRLVQSDVLKTLDPVLMKAASRPTCLEGTRIKLLDEISDWIIAPNSTNNVLWLSGVAGSGKSTVATTISVTFDGLQRLGAFLFFDRNNSSHSDPDRVICTLAHSLARFSPHIAAAISAAIEQNAAVVDAPLQTQFERLLLQPLLDVKHLLQGPILIVLDALDECGEPASRRNLLSVISDGLPKLPDLFRFLITSRREADISKSFAPRFVDKSVGTATSTEDVQCFFSHELERIQQDNKLGTAWPKETQKQTVISLAGGLFIWAATAIKYIDGYKPNDRIETLITSHSDSLDDLYSFTLRNSAPWDDKIFAKDACAVLACIVCGRMPMTDTTIDTLLGAGCSSADVLKYLGCVVQWRPGCVARTLHASFADYLTDDSRNKGEPWAIDIRTAHQILALGCLEIMNTQLQFNICGLEDSHILNVDVPNITNRVATCISPQLSYASCFWGDHIAGCPANVTILEGIDTFFHTRFLFWLEVLSLLNQVTVTSGALDAAIYYTQGHNNNLENLIIDTVKFVSVFVQLIAQSVPHIYLSALPFTPHMSWTASQYIKLFPKTLCFESQIGHKWPAVQKVLQGHTDRVDCVAFSPDGKRLVSGSYDTTVHIWDAQTGQILCPPLQGHEKWITFVQFSPDGTRIVSGSLGKVRIWETETGTLVAGPLTGTNNVCSAHFTPDGSQLLLASADETIRVWDSRTGALVVHSVIGYHGSPSFSPDGTRIASASAENAAAVCIWDTQTGTLVAGPFTGHTHLLSCLRFSPDGARIVSASYGNEDKIRIRNAQTGALVASPFTGHTTWVQCVDFSPDGTRVASGSHDQTVRVWDAQTGTLVAGPFTGHTGMVNSVHFSPDGTQIVSGSSDKTVRVWDAQPGAYVVGPLTDHIDVVKSVSFSPNGAWLALLYEHGTVHMLDTHTGQLAYTLRHGHTNCLAFSPDSMRVACGYEDTTIWVWDALTGGLLAGPFTGDTLVKSVQFSSDGALIASRYLSDRIQVWDAHTGVLVTGPVKGAKSRLLSVRLSPDGTQIAFGSPGNTVQVWDVRSGASVGSSLTGLPAWVNTFCFSPDGQQIAVGTASAYNLNVVEIWDVQTGARVAGPFIGHTSWIESLDFSSDGTQVVSGSKDKTVRIWDTHSGKLVAGPFIGHTDSVTSVHFSPDGTSVTSSSQDCTIRVCQVGYLTQNKSSSHTDPSSENLFTFDFESGWMRTTAGVLVFWVPPWLHQGLYLPYNTLVISPKGTTKLDLSRFVHGTEWTKCFDPKFIDTK